NTLGENRLNTLARFDVPPAHNSHAAPRGDCFAIRRKRQGNDGLTIHRNGRSLGTRSDVPKAYEIVRITGCDHSTVGRKTHGDDVRTMLSKRDLLFQSLGVP